MQTKTDQQGDFVTFVYDRAHRLLARQYRSRTLPPTDPPTDADSFTHDPRGNMLTAVSGRYNNTVAFSYDDAGRKATESLTIGGQSYSIGTSYDSASRLTQYTYPDGSVVERVYTPRGQLQQVKFNGTAVDTRAYDASGRMTSSAYNNGVSESRSYNADNTLAGIAFSGAPIGDLTYTWDANKNKTAESIPGVMSGFGFDVGPNGYDAEDRLINWSRADSNLSQQWALSPVGDWNTFTENASTQTRTHGPTHELLSSNGDNVTHDAKGNMAFIPASLRSSSILPAPASSLSLSWDFDNKMKSADVGSDGTADVFYHFDALGRRVARQSIPENTFTVFVQCDQQTIADYSLGSPAGYPTYLYTYASYIDEPITRHSPATSETLYYHRNQQYSIYALTDSTGTITERTAYTAYGVPIFLDPSAAPFVPQQSPQSNRYTYTAREWDTTLGLYHYRARMYEAYIGQFASTDPTGHEGSQWSLYRAYFIPGSTDPSGLFVCHLLVVGGHGAEVDPITGVVGEHGGYVKSIIDDWIRDQKLRCDLLAVSPVCCYSKEICKDLAVPLPPGIPTHEGMITEAQGAVEMVNAINQAIAAAPKQCNKKVCNHNLCDRVSVHIKCDTSMKDALEKLKGKDYVKQYCNKTSTFDCTKGWPKEK